MDQKTTTIRCLVSRFMRGKNHGHHGCKYLSNAKISTSAALPVSIGLPFEIIGSINSLRAFFTQMQTSASEDLLHRNGGQTVTLSKSGRHPLGRLSWQLRVVVSRPEQRAMHSAAQATPHALISFSIFRFFCGAVVVHGHGIAWRPPPPGGGGVQLEGGNTWAGWTNPGWLAG